MATVFGVYVKDLRRLVSSVVGNNMENVAQVGIGEELEAVSTRRK